LPGANDVAAFWTNLISARESVRHFSDDELRAAGVPDEELSNPRYVKAKPVIDDLEKFDAAFFNMPPAEAEVRDPQHRLFLEAAYTALEDAGRNPFSGGRVGVYAGSGPNSYKELNVAFHPDRMRVLGHMPVGIANLADYISTIVSYKLGLQGPSLNVLTACSSSLVAVHLAVRALQNGEVDTAVAGGVAVELPAVSGYYYSEGNIYSKGGHLRPFDSRADGTIFGTGCGVVVLRRLEDALRDGDRIYAVIEGSAINNDASDRVGFTAPSISGQRAVVQGAFDDAQITAADVDYVEAHGTGTLVGDPIEITALSDAFRARGYRGDKRVLIGSVKGNIGHLGPAAGVAGLIKTALALRHGQIPPSINYDEPNPRIGFEATPFEVATTLQEWPRSGARRAGVSSFGIGGTNAHIILREPPPVPESSPSRAWQPLLFSAKTETVLTAQRDNLAAHFASTVPNDERQLADAAYTLATGRPHLRHRQAAVVASGADAASVLRGGGARRDGRLLPAHRTTGKGPKVAFLFSGQGSQHLGAAAGLYGTEKVFTETVDALAEELLTLADLDVRAVIRGDAAVADRVDETQFAQPTLFVIEYALARQWMHWGVQPVAAIGHSVGELVAATVAGVFEPGDALRLVAGRGSLMQSMAAGKMLTVPVAADMLKLPDSVAVAAINAADLTVVAGTDEEIDALRERLAADGIVAQPLHTSHAFHSASMMGAVEPFTRLVSEVTRRRPSFPIVSNVTGEYLTDEQACDPAYWGAHLRQPVQFSRSLTRLIEDGCTVFLEVGPGHALTTLARRHLSAADAVALPSMRHPRRLEADGETLAAALATMWTHGVGIDWHVYFGDESRVRAELPTYPFERERYWLDGLAQRPAPPHVAEPGLVVTDDAHLGATAMGATAAKVGSSNEARKPEPEPEHGVRLFLPMWVERTRSQVPQQLPTGIRWLVFVGRDSLDDELVASLRHRGDIVTTVSAGSQYEHIAPGRYVVAPAAEADYDALFGALRAADALPDRIVHLWLADNRAAEPSLLDDAEREQEFGFYSLLALAKALTRHANSRPLHVDLVSRGVFGAVGDEFLKPARASVEGIVNLLPQELSPTTSRHIDLRAHPSAVATTGDEVQPLLTELLDVSVMPKVAVRGRKAWTWSYHETPVVPVAAAPRLLRERGVYLITGGLGGIGLVVAEDLARLVRAKVVLTSRSPFPDRDAWEATLADSQGDPEVVRKIEVLRRIEELGGSVIVAQADVADSTSMQRALELAEARFGRINGVFHAAGLPGGGMMAVKSRASAEAVLKPKLGGLRVIDELLADRVDFVVLFSSIASVATEFGLSDYGGANAVLDAYAHAHVGGRAHMVSITWGGWSESGMAVNTYRLATPEFRAMQVGLHFEEVEHPLPIYRGHLKDDDGLTTQFTTLVEPDSHWVIKEHQFNGTQVVPGTTFLELARAAYAEISDVRDGALIELRSVQFMAPLAITGPTEIRTVFFGEGPEHSFSAVAAPRGHNGRQWREYVRGRIRRTSAEPRSLDTAHLWSGLPSQGTGAESVRSSGVVTLGEHWQSVVERRADGGTMTMARLELPAPYREETKRYVLHPSLLDCATAIVLELPEATGPGKGFLPFSYGRVLVRRALPERLTTVIRHKSEPTSQLPSFDIALVADDGDVVVEIDDFAVRVFDREKKRELLSGGANGESHSGNGAADQPAGATIRTILGLPERKDTRLTNAAGLTALRQILDGRLGPQVIAVNEDLAQTLARASALTSDRVVSAAPARRAPDGNGTATEPQRGGSAAAPQPEGTVAEVLLKFMRDALGNNLDLDDDFFEQGGNSLVAVQVAARVRENLGVDLPLDRLFEALTVRQLAEMLEGEMRNRGKLVAKPVKEVESLA
jgi:acyl transferase domain-containing protein/acyl carrier protein